MKNVQKIIWFSKFIFHIQFFFSLLNYYLLVNDNRIKDKQEFLKSDSFWIRRIAIREVVQSI